MLGRREDMELKDLNSKRFFTGLITSEVDFILKEANLDAREEQLFLLRSKNISVEESAEIMNCSTRTCNRINGTMKNKISKMLSNQMAYSCRTPVSITSDRRHG